MQTTHERYVVTETYGGTQNMDAMRDDPSPSLPPQFSYFYFDPLFPPLFLTRFLQNIDGGTSVRRSTRGGRYGVEFHTRKTKSAYHWHPRSYCQSGSRVRVQRVLESFSVARACA